MEYVYAVLILNESGEELNEQNITAVLEAAGAAVEESRVKALVAALEDIDIATVEPQELVGDSAGDDEPPQPSEGDRAETGDPLAAAATDAETDAATENGDAASAAADADAAGGADADGEG